MPAPLTPLVDDSPLEGDHVLVAPRIAWLLRMARLGSAGAPSQSAVGAHLRARGVRTHARLMSEIENGKVRSGRIIDGYEHALGVAPGSLRAPIDVMCRRLPGSPEDRDGATPIGGALTVTELSELGARLTRPGHTGGDWLAWARALGAPEARGFPTWLAAEWLDRLLDQLGRSVGTAYTTRYEAVALLRVGPYGAQVLEAAQRAVGDPYAQIVLDTVGAVTYSVDSDLLAWGASLLRDPRPMALRGGCAILHQAATTARLTEQDWDPVVDALVAAHDAALGRESAGRLTLLCQAVTALPERQATAVRARLVRPPRTTRPLAGGPARTRVRPDRRWRSATELADRVAEPLGLPDRALLARLIFDFLHDLRDERGITAGKLIVAAPFADRVFEVLLDHARTALSGADRVHVLWRLTALAPPPGMGDLADLLREGPDAVAACAVLLAHAGRRVDPDVLDDLIARPEQRRRAIYAAGLVEDPWLEKVAQDSAQAETVRASARWWQGRGGLVTDAPLR